MKKEKKIPSIIGVIFLLLCVAAGVYLTKNKTTLGSKASGSCSAVNPQIANITNSSADLSFTTISSCTISLSVDNQIYQDVKSQNNSAVPSTIHYFQIKHLQPQTKYTYSLIAGGQLVNQSSYSFTTGSSPTSKLPTSNLAWGRVLNSDRITPANAIVYLNIPGAAPLSSFVTSNGNWSVSLANSFNESKNNWFTPPESGIDEDIIVVSDDGQTTQVANNTLTNNPVPDIIIGVNSLTAPTSFPTLGQSVGLGQVGTVSPAVVQKELNISNPKENESLTTAKPDFFGTAPINTSVSLFLDSGSNPSGQTTSDSSGTWHWSPANNLSLGSHTITAKIQDQASKLWSQINRTFIILASDSGNPQYEASASAKITATPTLAPTNTAAPSPEPTIRAARPSVSEKPPVTGNTSPTVIIVALSLIFFIVSLNLIK